MKKIFMTFTTVATLGTAVVLTSCGNAEELKKQTEEQDAKIQTLVDEKLAGLQTEADAECATMVEGMATALYDGWVATEGKKKGVKPKPAPKPAAKVEEPKKPGIGGEGKLGVESTPAKIGEGKMGTAKDTAKLGKGKLGGQTPK